MHRAQQGQRYLRLLRTQGRMRLSCKNPPETPGSQLTGNLCTLKHSQQEQSGKDFCSAMPILGAPYMVSVTEYISCRPNMSAASPAIAGATPDIAKYEVIVRLIRLVDVRRSYASNGNTG